ncbi:MAG: 30S ribosome-binding factor RbfA [Bacilli bacterium]
MSRKLARLESEMMHVLSSALIIGSNNRVLKDAFITKIIIAPDLSTARIMYSSYSDNKDLLEFELNKSIPFFRKTVSDNMNLRHTPKLEFKFDNSLHYRERIEQVLKDVQEKDTK